MPTGVRFRRPEADAAETAEPVAPPAPAITAPSGSVPVRHTLRWRYGITYDTTGPKVRLGVLWAVVVAASLAARSIRPYGTAAVFAVAAAVAALQLVEVWQDRHPGADRWVAAGTAALLPILAAASTRALGAGLVLLPVAALVAAAVRPGRGEGLLSAAGHTVLSALFVGGAAASVVVTLRFEIGAVIALLVFVGVYEASDYLVGTGASNAIEGPLAGIIAMAPAAFIIVLLAVPPFGGADAWWFAGLAAIGCPLGQVVGSALLPSAGTTASGVRRLDSLLVLGPAYAWLIGLYLTHH